MDHNKKIMALNKVKNQHIHMKSCIKRFCKSGTTKVEVKFTRNSTITRHHQDEIKIYSPKNNVFCGDWLWDWVTESNFSKTETAFVNEIDNAIKGLGKPRNHKAISDYHLLWWSRHYFKHKPMQDGKITGSSSHVLSNEDEENLESNGYKFANNGVMPARFLTSVMLWAFRRSKIDCYDGLTWGLVESQDGEFIVADCYQDTLFMPISPNKAFFANYQDEIVTRDTISKLNQLSTSVATTYYFASDFCKCPVV